MLHPFHILVDMKDSFGLTTTRSKGQSQTFTTHFNQQVKHRGTPTWPHAASQHSSSEFLHFSHLLGMNKGRLDGRNHIKAPIWSSATWHWFASSLISAALMVKKMSYLVKLLVSTFMNDLNYLGKYYLKTGPWWWTKAWKELVSGGWSWKNSTQRRNFIKEKAVYHRTRLSEGGELFTIPEQLTQHSHHWQTGTFPLEKLPLGIP